MAEDTIRVLRILEYVGPRSWIERTLAEGAVPMSGQHSFERRDGCVCTIRSAVLGQFPEILQPAKEPESPEPSVTG